MNTEAKAGVNLPLSFKPVNSFNVKSAVVEEAHHETSPHSEEAVEMGTSDERTISEVSRNSLQSVRGRTVDVHVLWFLSVCVYTVYT